MKTPKYRYLAIAATVVMIAMIGVATVSGDSILQQIRSTEGGVPDTLTYSGYLADKNGEPIDDTTTLKFALYDRVVGGRLLWEEGHRVDIKNGLFSVELGRELPIVRGLSTSPVWLGITVDGGAELTPRQKITAVPFAIRAQEALTALKAEDAQTLDGVPAASFVTESEAADFLTEDDVEDFVTADQVAGLQTGTEDVCNLEGRLRVRFFDFDISDECAPPTRELSSEGIPHSILDFTLNRAGLPTMIVSAANSNLGLLICTTITCDNFSLRELSDTAWSDVPALTFSQAGIPRIAYSTPDQDEIKLIQCSDINCLGFVRRTVTDDTSRKYRHVDVEIAPDDSLLFAYQSTNGQQFGPGFQASLRTAHCGNAGCTLFTRTEHQTSGFSGGPVFSGGGTGAFPVIRFGSNGLPSIAYTWNFNQRLMVAKCLNVRCNASDLDDREIVINGSKDFEFGSDGERPYIVYETTNGLAIHETCFRLDICSSYRDQGINIQFDGITVQEGDVRKPQVEMLDGDVPIFAYYLEDVGLVHGRCVNATCRDVTGSVVLDDAVGTFGGAVRMVIEPSTGDRLMTSGAYYIRCAGRCGFD